MGCGLVGILLSFTSASCDTWRRINSESQDSLTVSRLQEHRIFLCYAMTTEEVAHASFSIIVRALFKFSLPCILLRMCIEHMRVELG